MGNRMTLLGIVLGVSVFSAWSQQAFSLEEARKYAVQNNHNARLAIKEYEISKAQYNQALGYGLPQINGAVGYNFNVQPQVFLLPDFQNPGSGQFVQLEATPPTTMNVQLSASMTLLDGSYILGVMAGKTFKELSLEQKAKTDLEVKEAVTKAYYQVLIIRQNINVLEGALANLERVLTETQAYVKEGFRENLDGEQVKLNVDITRNTLIKARSNAEIAERGLKLQMGFPVDQSISLTDDFNTLRAELADEFILSSGNGIPDLSNNIDMRILDKLFTVNRQNKNLEMSKSFPSLRAFASYSYNGFSNDKRQPVLFGNNNTFYTGGALVGFSLNVPIFSSLSRYSSYKKALYEWQKAGIRKEMAGEGLKVQYENARMNYVNTWQTLQNDKANLALADKIRITNRVKFQEGLIGSFELTNAENQYLQALGAYYNTLFSLINYKLEFDRITNRL
jgi:outer membrane protein TolC